MSELYFFDFNQVADLVDHATDRRRVVVYDRLVKLAQTKRSNRYALSLRAADQAALEGNLQLLGHSVSLLNLEALQPFCREAWRLPQLASNVANLPKLHEPY